jgi:pimeloyl-ACP methyl ester carboxylesterase
MIRFIALLCIYFFSLFQIKGQELEGKRSKYLIELNKYLDLQGYGGTMVNHLDSTWQDWLKRTRELPPDFTVLPSIPNLPNPFVLDEGIKNRPVENLNDWEEKKSWIREQYQHWVLGNFPPKPQIVTTEVLLDSLSDNGVRIQEIKLIFGEEKLAIMRFKLFIPPGDGKKAVFMTQSTHERWAYIAVRRGYIGCVYAGGDSFDDTKNYQEVFAGYDFSTLGRRAWGASRVLDYLFNLEIVDKDKIAITGHSRNGKQAMFAAAFDERFTAIIASTGSIGGGLPFRFTDNKFDSESIDAVSKNFPDWFHPRLRFFMGREHKLPIDQNLLAATIAPRAFMFTSGYLEATSNTVGMEEMYKSLYKVYTFLGEDPNKKLYLRARNGLHTIAARDVEAYIDFLDRVFFDKDIPELSYRYNNFEFQSWKDNYLKFYNDTLAPSELNKIEGVPTDRDELPNSAVKKNLQWALGEEPPGIYNAGPKDLSNSRNAEDWVYRLMRARDEVVNEFTGKMLICPYNSMGDYQFADLYYPKNQQGEVDLSKGKLPVFIFQHSNSTATGYHWNIAPFIHELTRNGVAVLAYDLIGFGTRVEEGTLFYNRYPRLV